MSDPDTTGEDMTGNADPATAEGGGTGDGRGAPGPDESELLAAFDRMRPQGSLQWGFDDAMRRIARPETGSATAPWNGLPDDLWERGRSARIGRRFAGDVTRVLADLLAADARTAAAAAAAGVNVATWDALRYLAARVGLLEARVDPARLEAAELPTRAPDPADWVGVIGSWLGPPDPAYPVVVGESGGGALVVAVQAAGHRVLAVEPRGESAWAALTRPAAGEGPRAEVVLAEVIDHLGTIPDRSCAGAVLAGCVDRVDLAAKVGLLGEALRVTRAGGPVVVLTVDQSAWDEGLSHPARDLAPGRPLHPETWSLLLRRSGAVGAAWHRPTSGTVHAVVARAGP
ncbi:MAG TPA: hypothetical protein VMV06_09190 [Acidimicrobiales bacterium]|nr:hypothetical protein [Acidimicrobiales bacterium]